MCEDCNNDKWLAIYGSVMVVALSILGSVGLIYG